MVNDPEYTLMCKLLHLIYCIIHGLQTFLNHCSHPPLIPTMGVKTQLINFLLWLFSKNSWYIHTVSMVINQVSANFPRHKYFFALTMFCLRHWKKNAHKLVVFPYYIYYLMDKCETTVDPANNVEEKRLIGYCRCINWACHNNSTKSVIYFRIGTWTQS